MRKFRKRGLFSLIPLGVGEGSEAARVKWMTVQWTVRTRAWPSRSEKAARSRSGERAGCWGLEKAREKAHKFYRGLEPERHTRLKPSRKNFLGNSSPCSSLRSEQAVVTPQIQKKKPKQKPRGNALRLCFVFEAQNDNLAIISHNRYRFELFNKLYHTRVIL